MLLPAPEFVEQLHTCAGARLPTEDDSDPTPEDQLDIILSNITDAKFLSEMLTEVNNTPMNEANGSAGLVAIDKLQARLSALGCDHLIS